MSKTITSSVVTFMDTTDDNQLGLYISSNHPTVQILNTTSGTYTPDWSVENLSLTADAYIDTTKITSGLDIVWYKNSVSDETKVGTGTTLTISSNTLTDSASVTYICKVIYDGVQISKDIKFSKVETVTNIVSASVDYGVSDSAQTQPEDWSADLPMVENGRYLWTRTITNYSDPALQDSVAYTYARQGVDGETGTSGTSVSVLSIQYQEGASATTAPTGTWSPAVVAVADGKYLWTKTTFSDGKIAYGVAKQGSAGTAASLVNITPSALYFKSTTGKDGVFAPDYIYLYPRFQTVTYSNWQYSVDGGATWVAVSGANGLTIGTYNSVANSLRISKDSTLYTDAVTSISFKCNSNNISVNLFYQR